jgi:hypothetical protein
MADDLLAGTVITGTDVPEMASDFEGTQDSGITSTAYAQGTLCGTTFMAPTTGRVMVMWRAKVDIDTNQATYVSIEVREGSSVGSGTIFLSPSDEYAVGRQNTNNVAFGIFWPVEGLTPGATYNVRLMHRVTGGSGTVDDKEVVVIPLP